MENDQPLIKLLSLTDTTLQDLVDDAATLSQGQLRALGFRRDQHSGRLRCPGVTPFRAGLSRVSADTVERALLLWQEQLLGPVQDQLVIESRLHQALDEDRSRVRHKNAALVLGLFRRLVVSIAQTAIAQVQTPKTRWRVRR